MSNPIPRATLQPSNSYSTRLLSVSGNREWNLENVLRV